MDSPLSLYLQYHTFNTSPLQALVQLRLDLAMHCDLWNLTFQWDTSDFLSDIHISMGLCSLVFDDEEDKEEFIDSVNHIYAIWVWVGYYQYLINNFQHLVDY